MTTTSDNPKPITAYCRTCGKALTEDTVRVAMGTVFCADHVPQEAPKSDAGSPYQAAQAAIPNPSVSPGLAFLLGLIPGVGAIYNGQYGKGLIHVLVLGMLITLANNDAASGGLEPLFEILIPVFWFYMAFEAYHTARKRLAGEPVDEFSSLVRFSPAAGQFPVLPVVLIVFGALFLLNNLGLLRMSQVLRFWPVLMIGAGAWMLYDRLKGGTPGGPDNGEAPHAE